MTNQTDKLLDYLREHKNVTQEEAKRALGIARLAARIHELRDRGADIHREMVVVPSRGGHTASVAKYHLVAGPEGVAV